MKAENGSPQQHEDSSTTPNAAPYRRVTIAACMHDKHMGVPESVNVMADRQDTVHRALIAARHRRMVRVVSVERMRLVPD